MNSKRMKHKGLAFSLVLLAGLVVAAWAAAPGGKSCCPSVRSGVKGPAGSVKPAADPHAKLLVTLDGALANLSNAEKAIEADNKAQALKSIAKVKTVIADLRDRAKPKVQAVKGWTEDLDKALKYASASKRPILLNFSGSDWCGWCIKLHDEVFVKDAFKAYADKNLVLVELDFPRNKPQPADIKARNRKLMSKYGVSGFPTIVVLDPTGEKVLGRTGYVRGGLNAFIAEVKKIIGRG